MSLKLKKFLSKKISWKLNSDPYVEYVPAKGGKKEIPGGIGEEELVVLVLTYIKSAREGALRLGSLLEQYGTYEPNGIAFSDQDEIWWLESIGGHHWIARRVKDDEYVVMPNQFGLDRFDFKGNDILLEGKKLVGILTEMSAEFGHINYIVVGIGI